MAVKIEKNTIIGDVLDVAPQAAPLFFAIGIFRVRIQSKHVSVSCRLERYLIFNTAKSIRC